MGPGPEPEGKENIILFTTSSEIISGLELGARGLVITGGALGCFSNRALKEASSTAEGVEGYRAATALPYWPIAARDLARAKGSALQDGGAGEIEAHKEAKLPFFHERMRLAKTLHIDDPGSSDGRNNRHFGSIMKMDQWNRVLLCKASDND
jgi:hypothetical protein